MQVYSVQSQGVYFEWNDSIDLTGPSIINETLPDISFYYSGDIIPGYSDNISARISTFVKAPTTDTYLFDVFYDNGATIYFDNTAVETTFGEDVNGYFSFTADLVQDNYYPLYVLYTETTAAAYFDFYWSYTAVNSTGLGGSFYLAELVGSSPFTISSLVSI